MQNGGGGDSHNEVQPDWDAILDTAYIVREQQRDEEIQKIIQHIEGNGNENYYINKDGILYKNEERDDRCDKLVVPGSIKANILQIYHNLPSAGHVGFKKMYGTIKRQFSWKGMTTDIKAYCEKCHLCAIHKSGSKTRATLQMIPVPYLPFEKISVDIVGPLNETEKGNKYILTCMDYLTRYPECIPMADARASTVAKAFVIRVITRHGVPTILPSDCGSQFISKLFKEICKLLEIKKIQTTPFRLEANGTVERMHRTMKLMISHYVGDEDNNWDDWFVECALRNSVHNSTNETPFFLMHGRDMRLPS